MAVILTVTCALLTLATLVLDSRGKSRLQSVTKVAASLCAWSLPLLSSGDSYAVAILGGLTFGVVGDAALATSKRAGLALGLGAFLLGHLMYLIAFSLIVPPSEWWSSSALFVAALSTLAMQTLWPALGGFRIPVALYVALMSLMLIAALSARTALPGWQGWSLCIGALLFYISDLAVARRRFLGKTADRYWGLPCYFAAQLLLGWSTL